MIWRSASKPSVGQNLEMTKEEEAKEHTSRTARCARISKDTVVLEQSQSVYQNKRFIEQGKRSFWRDCKSFPRTNDN